jgi:23S rRNA (pseudouridine1915-N3)-methyltransferase
LKLWVIAVGRTGSMLQPVVEEYETRARRYWQLEIVEVKEERGSRGVSEQHVRDAEAERLLKHVPPEAELVALTRRGDAWSSDRFAHYLQRTADQAQAGIAFLIGGAYGLSDGLLRQAQRRMRLSTFTMPHDLARLVLFEQLYRAGTIMRGEPYHKGRAAP